MSSGGSRPQFFPPTPFSTGVIPAKAGIHVRMSHRTLSLWCPPDMDSGLRRNDPVVDHESGAGAPLHGLQFEFEEMQYALAAHDLEGIGAVRVAVGDAPATGDPAVFG